MAALSEKNTHAPSEVVGRASEVAGAPFKFLTSILYILLFIFILAAGCKRQCIKLKFELKGINERKRQGKACKCTHPKQKSKELSLDRIRMHTLQSSSLVLNQLSHSGHSAV